MRVGLRKSLLLGVAVLITSAGVLLASPSAWAAACVPGTIASYIALGAGGCTISTAGGDISFHDFSYASSSFGTALAVPASGVGVTPDGSGFLFNAPWFAASLPGNPSATDSLIQYSATGLGGTLIDGADLSIAGHVSAGSGALVLVAENLANGVNLEAHNISGLGVKSSDSATFSPVSSLAFVFKDIGVSGGVGPGFAGVSGVYNHLNPVPEPGSFMLLGSALPGLWLLRRRFRLIGKS